MPPELLYLIQQRASAYDIQSFYRTRLASRDYLFALLIHYNKKYNTTPNYEKPWLILDPSKKYTADWLDLANNILEADDFSKGPQAEIWYNCILHVLNKFQDVYPDKTNIYIGISEERIRSIIEKMGYFIDIDAVSDLVDQPYLWANNARYWLEYESGYAKNAFGKSKVPDNVKDKALYQRIKNKIRKEVDKKGRRWGAYDSGRLVREYKEKGGKYSGSKNKKEKSDLSRWYKEKWIDACAWPKKKSCGRTKSNEKIAYCRPSKKIDANTPKLIQELTKSEIKSRCLKKNNNPKKKIF